MAEPKRHMDVLERVLEGCSHPLMAQNYQIPDLNLCQATIIATLPDHPCCPLVLHEGY